MSAQDTQDTDEIVRCPWCGRPARNDAFDTPAGTVVGYYWCYYCDTHEVIYKKPGISLYPDEIESGWFRPSSFADTPLRFTHAIENKEEIPF